MLVFENEKELQRALIVLNDTFERFHLQINVGKTKAMIVNFHQHNDISTYPEAICNFNQNPTETIKKFRYLGDDIQFDQSSTGDAENDLCIAVAKSKFNQLYKKLTNRNIKLKWRMMIPNSMVRRRLTYLCQTWNLTQQQQCYISTIRISCSYCSPQ